MSTQDTHSRFDDPRFVSVREAYDRVEMWIYRDQRRRVIAQCAVMMHEAHMSWWAAARQLTGLTNEEINQHIGDLVGERKDHTNNDAFFEYVSLWLVREMDKPGFKLAFPVEWAATKEEIIQEVSELYAIGLNATQIAAVMNHDGYRGTTCEPITPAVVQGIKRWILRD